MKSVIVFLLSVMIAVPVLAGPPADGTYKSTDIGGTMLPGRYSESWFPTKLSVNNTLNEQSWNGVLGTQWHWYCPWVATPASLQLSTVDANGNGIKVWKVEYAGGFCWLDGMGPWAGGDASYLADVMNWTAIITETYSNFVEVGTVRTHAASAQFQNYPQACMALNIDNTEKIGDTDHRPLDADYPNFWDWTSCSDIGPAGPGEWGDVDSITFTIQGCTVATQQKSWGAVKSIYR